MSVKVVKVVEDAQFLDLRGQIQRMIMRGADRVNNEHGILIPNSVRVKIIVEQDFEDGKTN